MKKITLLLFVALTGMLNIANAQQTLYSENFESNFGYTSDLVVTVKPSTKAGTWIGGVNLETAGDADMGVRYGWQSTNLSISPSQPAVTIPNINVANYTDLSLSILFVVDGGGAAEVPSIDASVDGGANWVPLTTVAGGASWSRSPQSIALPAATSTISLRINPPTTVHAHVFDDFVITGTAGVNGINQLSDNTIQVYPNPTTKYIFTPNAQKVSIVDLKGRIVNETLNTEKVDVSSLANGAYIVKVKTNGATKIGKLIKQ